MTSKRVFRYGPKAVRNTRQETPALLDDHSPSGEGGMLSESKQTTRQATTAFLSEQSQSAVGEMSIGERDTLLYKLFFSNGTNLSEDERSKLKLIGRKKGLRQFVYDDIDNH